MALDPQLLEILACPEDKGPLLYFADEERLYNPRLKRRYAIRDDIPVMLIDEAETVDDAEHDRLLAKAEAEGIKPTFERRLMTIDRRTRQPGHARGDRGPARAGRRRGRGGAAGSTACPTATTVENVVVLGMGGSGIAGDILLAAAAPFMAVPVVVVEVLHARPPSSARARWCSPSRSPGDTEETVEAATEAAVQGARVVAVTSGGELAKLAAGGARPSSRCPTDHPAAACRARAPWPSRPSSCSRRSACSRAPPSGSTWRSTSCSAAATRWSTTATRPRRWPGASAAPSRSSTAAAPSAPPRPQRWKTQINENAKVARLLEPDPSWASRQISRSTSSPAIIIMSASSSMTTTRNGIFFWVGSPSTLLVVRLDVARRPRREQPVPPLHLLDDPLERRRRPSPCRSRPASAGAGCR